MTCTLMHKNISVADVEIDSDNGYIDKIGTIHAPEHLPIGTTGSRSADKNKPNRAALNDWWLGRSIPASRDKIEAALCALDLRTPAALIVKCYGLSLSDQYWIMPKDSGLNWSAVNFFDNDFSGDIGEILFGKSPKYAINMLSPDGTSDGWLRKKWSISEGKRVLIKGGSGVFEQEPFNEVVATAVMKRLQIPHVAYDLLFESASEGEKAYSVCENFVTSHTELVPAWRVVQTMKRLNNESEITHLLRCCKRLGMEMTGIISAIDKMLTLDYIIANEDRHYNNFGFLRNAETLEWIGFAPVYDSGTSLWYNTQRVGSAVESKPFRKNHDEQLKLVQSLSWFDCDALKGIESDCAEIFARSSTVALERAKAIGNAVVRRAGLVEQMRIDLEIPSVTQKIKAHKNIVKQPSQKKKTVGNDEPDL